MFVADRRLTCQCPAIPAFSDAEEITCQDLVPPMDESFILNNDVPLDEQIRMELNNKNVQIPGFIVPADFENRQVVTRFFSCPTSAPAYTSPHRSPIKRSTQNLNPVTLSKVSGIRSG